VHFFIHLFANTYTESWLLWGFQWECRCVFDMWISFPLAIYSAGRLLVLTSCGTSIPFSWCLYLIYILINSVQGFLSFWWYWSLNSGPCTC
jgi:hypothetical protein